MNKIVKIGFVAVFAAVEGYGVYTSQKSEVMSDLVMANVEALAMEEGDADPNTFYGFKATNCVKDNRIVGATCARAQPEDECKRSSIWGIVNR